MGRRGKTQRYRSVVIVWVQQRRIPACSRHPTGKRSRVFESSQRLIPRALIGQTASTCPPRTPTT